MRHQSTFCSKWAPLSLYFLLALGSIVTAFIAVLRYSTHTLNLAYLLLPSLLVVASILLFSTQVKKWKNEPSLMFLLIAMPAVCAFCLFLLPGFVPDEDAHICRMFSFAASGSFDMVLPSVFADVPFPGTYEDFSRVLATPYGWEGSYVVDRDLSSYLPHMYLLPGLCSELLEALNVNPFLTILVCRGVNGVLFLAAGYWIIKILPLGKTVMFVYLLNPMLIQQEASCSADAFVNVVCLLFIAVILNARFTKGKLSKWQIGSIVILAVLIPCSKYGYAPLLLLLLVLLPRIKNKKIRIAIPVVLAVLAVGAVMVVVSFYHSSGPLGYAVDLVRDPLLCISVVAKTLYVCAYEYVQSFAGASLGLLEIPVFGVCFILFYCLLTASLFISLGEKASLNRPEKILVWCLSLVIMVLLMLSMRQWSVEYKKIIDIIWGVQGRYFLPFAILLFFTGFNPKRHITCNNVLVWFGGAMAFPLLASIGAICRFFM